MPKAFITLRNTLISFYLPGKKLGQPSTRGHTYNGTGWHGQKLPANPLEQAELYEELHILPVSDIGSWFA